MNRGHAALEQMLGAVERAGAHALARRPTRVNEKQGRELVTEIDRDIETAVRAELPTHLDGTPVGFLGEEHGHHGPRDTYWVLDPIDGTTNYVHHSPLFAITLGLIEHHDTTLAVVALPALGATYHARAGHGAYRDDTLVTVSATTRLDHALIGLCDYGDGPGREQRDHTCGQLDQLLTAHTRGVRRHGSTALDLVWLADGTHDAAVLVGNRTWDTAAAALIAHEAGATVLDLTGAPHTITAGSLLACTPSLATPLTSLTATVAAPDPVPATTTTTTPGDTGP